MNENPNTIESQSDAHLEIPLTELHQILSNQIRQRQIDHFFIEFNHSEFTALCGNLILMNGFKVVSQNL